MNKLFGVSFYKSNIDIIYIIKNDMNDIVKNIENNNKSKFIILDTFKHCVINKHNIVFCKLELLMNCLSSYSKKFYIVNIFLQNVKNKDVCCDKKHHGSEGHWLENLFYIKHNNYNEPDIYNYELKKYSNKITFGDFSASEYLFSKNKSTLNMLNNNENYNITRDEFLKLFGSFNKSKNRWSWSGKSFPKINNWNEYGQIIRIKDKNVYIYYSLKYDKYKKNTLNLDYDKEIVIALWTCENLKNKIENKFNKNGFILCKKNKNKYNKIYFGKPFDYEFFLSNLNSGDIFIDSGMYETNNRNYSMFRANKNFWEKLIIEEY